MYKKYNNGNFITCTTRKANHTDIYFGKFTFWGNKYNYDNGICDKAVTIKDVELGNDKYNIDNRIDKFINFILQKVEVKNESL